MRKSDDELKRFVSKLNQKKEGLFFQLINVELKRREMQKRLERRMRKRPIAPLNPGELDDPLGL